MYAKYEENWTFWYHFQMKWVAFCYQKCTDWMCRLSEGRQALCGALRTEMCTFYIYTWAKVLHIFKEAKLLGNLCEKCSNYLYQHTTQVFCYISAKVLLFWFIPHREIDDDQWQRVTYQNVSLPVACGRYFLNLTQWDYSSTFIVSMPPKRCQPISMYVIWQIIGLRRSGLKQMDILNLFGDGHSDVSRILSKHHQTGSAKDKPCLGGPKKTNAREGSVLARMAIQDRTKSSSQLARVWGINSTLDCPDSLSAVGYLSQGFAADGPESKLHWMPGTKGNVCNGPNNIARDAWIWHRIRWSDQSQLCFYHVDGRIGV